MTTLPLIGTGFLALGLCLYAVDKLAGYEPTLPGDDCEF